MNWYLTDSDDSNDGKFTQYLKDERMRRYAPEIFDVLKDIVDNKNKSVQNIQKRNLIPGAVFYDEKLRLSGSPKERTEKRTQWFERSIEALRDAELIFMDPDNGLLINRNVSASAATKYILPEEAEQYFRDGHNVVYYCHKGRRTSDSWREYISYLFIRNPDAVPCVLTYHKGSQRSYVFLIHEKDFAAYRRIIDCYQRKWGRIVSEEYTNKGDAASVKIGVEMVLEKTDGTKITISKRADGRVAIVSSRQPGSTVIRTVDHMCSLLGF